MENYQEIYGVKEMQLVFVPGQDNAQAIDGLQSFSNKEFGMMWYQMFFITAIALTLSVALSQGFTMIAPEGMPFILTLEITIQLSIIFLIIGFIGATLSGFQIRKVEPLHAIQQGEI